MLELHEHFYDDLPAPEAFKQEVKMWKHRWNYCSTPVPHGLSETLELNSKAYPNIFTVLQLLLVVPVTAATVERGNSKVCKE